MLYHCRPKPWPLRFIKHLYRVRTSYQWCCLLLDWETYLPLSFKSPLNRDPYWSCQSRRRLFRVSLFWWPPLLDSRWVSVGMWHPRYFGPPTFHSFNFIMGSSPSIEKVSRSWLFTEDERIFNINFVCFISWLHRVSNLCIKHFFILWSISIFVSEFLTPPPLPWVGNQAEPPPYRLQAEAVPTILVNISDTLLLVTRALIENRTDVLVLLICNRFCSLVSGRYVTRVLLRQTLSLNRDTRNWDDISEEVGTGFVVHL